MTVASGAARSFGETDARSPLRAGLPIIPGLDGRLGPLFRDSDGRIVSLTAAHLFPSAVSETDRVGRGSAPDHLLFASRPRPGGARRLVVRRQNGGPIGEIGSAHV